MSRRPGKPKDVSKEQPTLRADTSERLEAIVEAAERAAESVIDDAEAQARKYLAQAQAEAERSTGNKLEELSELIDVLLAQALSLRQETERLQATLEVARDRIEGGAESATEERAQEAGEQPMPPRLHAVGGERQAPDSELQERRSDAAGARLLATQMAVSGSSREEIEQKLRNGFEIEDTDAIIDAILGPKD